VKGIKEIFENDPELQVYFAHDIDSRFQSDKGKIRHGYNAQTVVDDQNKLIVANDVTQKSNDIEQMTPMIEKVQDLCICPVGKELNKQNKNPRQVSSGIFVNEYRSKECDGCVHRPKCTDNKTGRTIRVSINRESMDDFKKEMGKEENKKLICKRKEIVEHPFGIIKRNLGFTYFMQKGLGKVQAEFSFICFVYNLKRVINILGIKAFMDTIKANNLEFKATP
jgi:hypothetical protein